MRIDIAVRNSQDNKPVNARLNIYYEPDTGGKVEVAKNLRVDAQGQVSLEVTETGKYAIKVSAEGFISTTAHYTMRCPGCDHNKLVTISPELEPGQTRIMMTWERDIPKDLDIRVMSVKKSTKRTCKTFYGCIRESCCRSISMDRDNIIGGNNGSETITLLDNNVNKDYTYVIGVEEYGLVNQLGRWIDPRNQGQSFLDSGLEIRITNGVREVERIMVADSITTKKE